MRIHCIIDEKSLEYVSIPFALEKLKEQYSGIVDLVISKENGNLSGLRWVDYFGNNYGVDTNWIREDTKRFPPYSYDCIVYFIDESNWTIEGFPAIFGWNLGLFYNSFQVELVRARENERGVELTLKMEVAHALDNFVFAELGTKLSEFFNVPDFDEDIIHGRMNPPYQVFEYRPAIEKMGDLLIETFKRRLMRYKLSLLQKLLSLYRMFLIRVTSSPSPVTQSELKGRD